MMSEIQHLEWFLAPRGLSVNMNEREDKRSNVTCCTACSFVRSFIARFIQQVFCGNMTVSTDRPGNSFTKQSIQRVVSNFYKCQVRVKLMHVRKKKDMGFVTRFSILG